ncbi:endoribonuclease Dcr-2 isoform X2 [Lycorma delicatula]|uniref:endoribonuclease Dcr-2 isoform X2 n=1 Tax=Lycorma delicatula TaxID=130591 RepID=UPI003F514CA0
MVGSEMSSYSPTHRCNSLPLKPGLDVKDKSSAYEQEKMYSNNNNNNNVDDDDSNNCNDFTARDYQDELLSFAVKENAILYLPTGSGKTFIATMLIKSFSSFIERPFSEGFKGSKRAFFLVNTVELVNQQAKAIRRHTSFKVGQYSGDMNVDLWTKERWLQELEFNSVIVMTAQILLNMLQHYYLKVNDIKVIVFDECHRAVKDHPMRSIMRYFERVPQDEQPRVLGLTGSLLNSTIKTTQVSSYIRDMENTFLSRIITAKSEDMANQINSFSTDPTEELIKYTSEDDNEIPLFTKCNCKFDELKSVIKCITLEDILEKPAKPQVGCVQMNDEFKLNKKLGNMVDDIVFQMRELGMYGGYKATLAHIIQLERLKRIANNYVLVSTYQSMITVFTLIRKFCADTLKEHSQTSAVLNFSTNKVIEFLNLLKGIKKEDKVIVFVERRFSCKVIFYLLQDLNKTNYLPNVSADFIVGYNNNPFNDTREGLYEKKINKDVMKKFTSGETNVLVASDVLEEGIDVQSCNVVIKFNPPKTARSYIQSKGRARSRDSRYFIMVDSKDVTFSETTYNHYKRLEELLKEELVGKYLLRVPPSKEELDKSIFNHAIEPFCPLGPEGPKLTGAAAISLVNRYCSSLHVDFFTKLTPFWWKELVKKTVSRKKKLDEQKDLVIVRLQLPNSSPIRDTISGLAMDNLDLAKRSAALEACKVLYNNNELDSHLLPRGRSSDAMEDRKMFPNWEDEDDDTSSRKSDSINGDEEKQDERKCQPGTKKQKRLYSKKYPDCLSGCRPVQGVSVYMHVIHVAPQYPEPEDHSRRRAFYNLLKSDFEYAILSTKQMPQVAEFPLFMSTGEVKISFSTNSSVIFMTNNQINSLINFHSLLFDDITRTVQSFMLRDNENAEQAFLFAPVKPVNNKESSKYEVNWDVVTNNQSLPPIEPLSEEERKNIKVTDENYNNCVVVPWYRGFEPRQAYIVTAVSDYEDAHSPFPSDEFEDYEKYFTNKYAAKVSKLFSPKEMLLEVRAVSKQLNCLKPRGPSKGLTSKRRRKEEEEFEETLVAELCIKYNIPGVYWLKATLLPSIVHRFTHLLLAEELRQTIITELCTDIEIPAKGLDKMRAVEVDHLSMIEQDEDLLGSSVSTAKTVTIKPKTTLPIKETVYPWGDEQEPIDFQRHIDEVKLIDIYFFDDFISKPLSFECGDKKKTKIKLEEDVPCKLQSLQLKDEPVNDMPKWIEEAPTLVIFKEIELSGKTFNVQQAELLQALTASSAHDVFNLERLETLGDSFLKYSVSLILYMSFPKLTEGQLTNIKGKIIGNRNLFYCGKKLQLGSILKVTEYSTECDWISPGFCVDRALQKVMRDVAINPRMLYHCNLSKAEQTSGKLLPETKKKIEEKLLESQEETDMSNVVCASFLSQQVVPDKTISDSVEAMLGLYIKNCGLEMGFRLLRFLGVMKTSLIHPDFYKSGPVPSSRLTPSGSIEFHLHNVDKLEKLIGYRFVDRSFLLQALSHPTYQPNNITPTYQRLEFLGDAILDFLITCHIFETCSSTLTPGALTDLRSALVNNITLATISVRIGLNKFLLMRSCKLSEVIDAFVQRQEERNDEIDDQVLFLIQEDNICIAEAVEVPKVLGDVFESIVAAIFLDSGKCLKTTWNFIYKFMKKEIESYSAKVPKNHIRLLYEENVSVKFRRCHIIEEFGRIMVPVEIFYNGEYKTFYGFGETKAQAKRAAAKLALRHIHS